MPTANSATLSASLEDYLEAIFWIVREKQAVRAKDIATRLRVGRSSVTGALQALAKRQLINYAPYDVITLTDKGQTAATDVVRRHEVLRDFFVKVLAIRSDDADEAACRMEHAISDATLERFVDFIEFIEQCPGSGSKWIEDFKQYCEDRTAARDYENCVEQNMDNLRSKNVTDTANAQTETTLSKMSPGDKAAIVKIGGQGSIRRRLLDMGATAGAIVEIERVAPLGDPIAVKIKGYHLTLRKEEAERITVNPIEN